MSNIRLSKLSTTVGVAAASLTFTAINAGRAVTSESVGFGTKMIGIVLQEGTRFVAGDVPAEIVNTATNIITSNTKTTINTGILITATVSAAAVYVGAVIIVTSAELLAIAAAKPVAKIIRYIKQPKKTGEIECEYDIEELDNDYKDYEIITLFHTPEEHENQFLDDIEIIETY